jgi:phage-related tail fiber protein
MQAYADSLQAGFSIKAPVMAIATGNITLSGAQTVDGVSLVAGNRVLVAGQTSGADNGIYVVASGAWARSADADSSSEVKDGMSVFVEQGTTYGDSTWVLVTNNAIALGSTALTFVQFSGLGQITAGAGLSKTGNELSVNVGNGLAIVADSVKVSLSEVSGLEFHANGGLEIKSNPTKGIFVDNDGIYLGVKQPFEFNDNQLDLRLASADRLAVANGNLDVTGLPLQFKINGAAASTSVTASALTALTGNGGGDNYHWHAKLRSYLLASESIANVGTAVYVSGSGTVGSASCSTAATARVIGLAIGSATTGGAVTYVMHGVHQFSGRTFAPGTAYYLGANGLPVEYSALGSGDRVVRVGYGVTGDTMQVAIQDIGQKA